MLAQGYPDDVQLIQDPQQARCLLIESLHAGPAAS